MTPSPSPFQGQSPDAYLQRLRGYRNRADPDLSLGYLQRQFQQQVEKPFKQLGDLAPLWRELVPAKLVEHTRLLGLSRGVLRVGVGSAAHHYELDRLLRGGLEREMIRRHKGAALRRIKLSVRK